MVLLFLLTISSTASKARWQMYSWYAGVSPELNIAHWTLTGNNSLTPSLNLCQQACRQNLEHLIEMVTLAETLSSDFEFVRVDLYDFDGKIYFGELTFSPWGGIMNSYSNEGVEILGRKFDE